MNDGPAPLQLGFNLVSIQPEPYAVVPTLVFRLRVTEGSGARVDALSLRTQVRIEPKRRRYLPAEGDRLLELFGTPERWSDTQHAFLWAHLDCTVRGFSGVTEVDLPMVCTYDFEVAAAKYLAALEEGEVPLLLLFSGTAWVRGPAGLHIAQVPWEHEVSCVLPVATWRQAMDQVFPGCAWVRLDRDALDTLAHYKAVRALPTWGAAIADLVDRLAVGEST